MYKLSGVTDAPYQKLIIAVPNNPQCIMELFWYPTQSSWYFNLTYQDFVLNGKRVTTQINMLRQWRHIIPFGIGCLNQASLDPTTIDAFSSGDFYFTVLSASDVDYVESALYPGS